jgi:hypothetical protein
VLFKHKTETARSIADRYPVGYHRAVVVSGFFCNVGACVASLGEQVRRRDGKYIRVMPL